MPKRFILDRKVVGGSFNNSPAPPCPATLPLHLLSAEMICSLSISSNDFISEPEPWENPAIGSGSGISKESITGLLPAIHVVRLSAAALLYFRANRNYEVVSLPPH